MYGKPTENPPAYESVGYTSRTSSMTVDFCCIATSLVARLFAGLPDFRGHKGFGRFGSVPAVQWDFRQRAMMLQCMRRESARSGRPQM